MPAAVSTTTGATMVPVQIPAAVKLAGQEGIEPGLHLAPLVRFGIEPPSQVGSFCRRALGQLDRDPLGDTRLGQLGSQ